MHNNRNVFAAACVGMLLFGVVFLSLGSVNNMVSARFHLDDNSIGTLTALLPLGILIGSLVFGPVVDRFGYKWILTGAALLVVASLEGMAFATAASQIQGWVFLVGLGGGILNGATNALAAEVSEGQRGARLSLLGVFFGIGAIGMPGILALLSGHFELSSIVAGIGLVGLLPAAYFMAISFPPPKQQNGKFSIKTSLSLLKHPIFLFAGLALAVQSGMEGMSNDWITRFFKKVVLAGESAAESKMLLGLVAVTAAMTGARIALSRILLKASSEWVLFVSIAITAAGALVLMGSTSYGLALLAAMMIGTGLAAAFPIVLSYIADLFPSQCGTAFSTIFFLALVGNMAINKAFGKLAQMHGVQQYTRMILGCLACSAVLLFLVIKQLRKQHSVEKQLNEQPGKAMAQ